MNLADVEAGVIRAEAISDGECPSCGGWLVFHQPDEELPERLLATCPCCKVWLVTEGDTAAMVHPPITMAIR